MSNIPLLSIICTNKNDHYHVNQLQRTKFLLNYFIYTIEKIGALNKVEYIIVDWGSNEPFSNYFHKEISTCSAIKFINIPKEETEKCEQNFDHSKALNIGIENSSGEHIMITSSDQFFPLSNFNNLLNILEKPSIYGLTGDEYKLVPRKFLKDDFFIYNQDMKTVDMYFQSLMHSAIPYPYYPLNSGAGAGGHLLKRKQFLQIGGLKDTKPHNRGQDRVLLHETSQICLHIDTASFGSFLLKLPRTKAGSRKENLKYVESTAEQFTFGKHKNPMDLENIEIINNLNLPSKKLDFNTKPFFKKSKSKSNGIIDTIKTIIDCTSLTYFFGLKLKAQDINFILKMKDYIEINKLKNIVLDERQAIRFTRYLARVFPDIKIIILIGENTSLNVFQILTQITESTYLKNTQYYGNIQIVYHKKKAVEMVNELQETCIMQDLSADTLPSLRNEFNSYKIHTLRSLVTTKKMKMYTIIGDKFSNMDKLDILILNIFIRLIINISFTFRKVNKSLGRLKKILKKYYLKI